MVENFCLPRLPNIRWGSCVVFSLDFRIRNNFLISMDGTSIIREMDRDKEDMFESVN